TDTRGHTTQTWMGRTITGSTSITSPFGTDTNGPGGATRNLYTNVPPFDVYTPQTYVGLVSSGTKKTLGINYQIVNIGGACGVPTTTPSVGASGTVTWTFPGGTTLPGSSTRTFIFTVNAGTSGGTYFNAANVSTSVGTLTGTDTTGVTVRTASLLETKAVSL